MTLIVAITISALVLAFPYWLPPLVVRLRMTILTRINGDEALQLPNDELGADAFRSVYSHAAAGGRSRGAKLSDLFWYWLAPGPHMHQEHIENGPRYEKIARFTRHILAVPRTEVEKLVDTCVARTPSLNLAGPWRLTRVRDMMMPLWANFYYELVFREECTEPVRDLIVANADDVVTALKACGLRHMKRRKKLTAFLISKLASGEFPHCFPEGFSIQDQAYYLQCTFFNTAVVQMSEAMAHLLMVLAQHPGVQERLVGAPEDRHFYSHVINETLRLYPLFGIAHRITSEDIDVNGQVLERGSVVCFNYPAYHKLHFEQADSFQPDRWRRCPMRESNHIPFGVTSNRPCPARGIALISMRRLAQAILRHKRFSTSAAHSRSLPNRGPCLVIARDGAGLSPAAERLLLAGMKLCDQWENAYRSIMQSIFGTIMIIDARRLRLCENYFGSLETTASNSEEGRTDICRS